MVADRLLVLLWSAQLALVGGLIDSQFRPSGLRRSAAARRLAAAARSNSSVPAAAVSEAAHRAGRRRRQTLAVPEGSVIGVIPKFGWLLYQGEDDEELDFVVETEFLYRFPGSTESEVGETRSDGPFYDSGFDYDAWLAHRRQKRMVRDKNAVYKSVSGIFSRLGLEGKSCLLKTICEITGSPLLHDGLIGELLNMALIPSHTVDGAPDELDEYREAERLGASGRSCQAAFSQCPVSLFKQMHA
ncbi:hypothetical protein FJT64_023386 [Amphibalanus amphitrite]|uniref:Uncharacterized protein n=1 Tax=Amphibalanus amphitrite TaxID=1232801 RepID=A0A6A4WHZ8_AMPAM|nr:uncharacterized protein LOC122386127 [Amphibalanus amphitrite]KAF0304879.1 hypothetical protein FJT64_023386 [Amphibalanus amphitrite]